MQTVRSAPGCAVFFMGLGVTLLAAGGCGRHGFEEDLPTELNVQPKVAAFTGNVGETLAPMAFTLSDLYGDEVEWQGRATMPWILVDPSAGQTPAVVNITVNTRDLAPGSHAGEVIFTVTDDDSGTDSAEAIGTELTEIVVQLTIQAPGWSEIEGFSCGDIETLVVNSQDTDQVMAVSPHAGIFQSHDGGATFQRGTMALTSNDIVTDFLFTDDGQAFATVRRDCTDDDGGGLYRSDDGGTTWAPTSLQNLDLHQVVTGSGLILARGGGIWASADDGITWSHDDTINASLLINAPTGSGFWIGDHDGGLWTTSDGVTSGPLAAPTTRPVRAVMAGSDGRIFMGVSDSPNQLWASADDGVTWERLSGTGLPDSDSALRMVFEGDVLWAVDGGVYRSTDFGETFQAVHLSERAPAAGERARRIALHPDGPLFADGALGVLRYDATAGLVPMSITACRVSALEHHLNSGTTFGATYYGGAFRLLGDGTVEGLGGNGLPTGEWMTVSVDPRTTTHLWLGGWGAMYGTTDGGQNWAREAVGIPGGICTHDVHRAPDDPDVIWLAGCTGLYRSTDNGLSFTELETGSRGRVAPLSSSQAVYNGDDGIWLQDVSAGTTTQLYDDSPGLLYRTWDGSIWYMDGSHSLHRSTDDGATFVDIGLIGPSPRQIALDPNDTEHIYVLFESDLFESADGGATWTALGSPFAPRSLTFDGGGDLLIGSDYGGIYRYAAE